MIHSRFKSPLSRSVAIFGVALLLGVGFDQLFFKHAPGLSFPAYAAGLLAGLFGLAAYLGHKIRPGSWWLAVPFAGFAAMVALRASEPLTLLNLGACWLLLLLMAQTTFRRRLPAMHVVELVRIPLLPLQFFRPAWQTLGRLVATHRIIKTKPMTRQIVTGIALAVPMLIVFVALFASADLVVHKYVTDLISVHVRPEFIAQTVLTTLATFALVGGYAYIFEQAKPDDLTSLASRKPLIGKVESAILLGSVNVLFLAFIIIQLTYLFGGQANISGQDFTYAEYARKGFFELLAVAVVAFGLLWWSEKHISRTEQDHETSFKVLGTLLILQVLLIMGSAFKRLYLYEQAYGFTTLRLYSQAFTILLAVVFLILAYKILRSAAEQAMTLPILVAVIAFLCALNAIDPDAFIARQNLDRYRQTGKIDTAYLGRLSADATPTLLNNYPVLPAADATALAAELNRQRVQAILHDDHDWRSWNLAQTTASTALANKAEQLQEH